MFSPDSWPLLASVVAGGLVAWKYKVSSRQRLPMVTPKSPLVVGVLGAGAVGTATGLSLLGHPHIQRVVLVGRTSLKKALAASQGQLELCLHKSTSRSFTANAKHNNLQVVSSLDDPALACLDGCDVLLLATKSTDTPQIASLLSKAHLPTSTTLLVMQNGLDRALAWKHHLPASQASIAGTVLGFNAILDGHKCQINAQGGKMYVELPQSTQSQEHVHVLCQAWNQTGGAIHAKPFAPEKFELLTYLKFLGNQTNAINALAGLSIPDTMADPGYRKALAASIRETAHVFATPVPGLSDADNKPLSPSLTTRRVMYLCSWIAPFLLQTIPTSIVAKLFASVKPDSTSSMLQDIDRHRPTEIHELNGCVEQAGIQRGMPTPINSTLQRLVQQAVQESHGSPHMSSDELWKHLHQAESKASAGKSL
eukprot:Nitzschia sp. Nitz4//scaffold44_size153857//95813//97084//NITZ4_002732-RA/size153857-processed-gene-0.129-mRNA-1//1//CDS//3329552190//2599//frame0